eukprot:jgi/Galph1/1238/GphlegSOOS_G6033.1
MQSSVQSVKPSEAHQRKLAENWKHLDVRTKEEYDAGHAKDSVCVPVMFRTKDGKFEENPSFLDEVKRIFKPEDKILVSCLKGPRGQKAVEKLTAGGFSTAVNIEGGFESWQKESLPTEK